MKRVLVYTAAAVATMLVGTGCEGDFIEKSPELQVSKPFSRAPTASPQPLRVSMPVRRMAISWVVS